MLSVHGPSLSYELMLRKLYTRIPGLAWLYVGLGVVLWFFPLIGLLHAESSAVVAGVAFFAAGLSAMTQFGRNERLAHVYGRQLMLLFVPWALLTISLLWRENCDYFRGLAFYLIFVPASTVFGVSLAYLTFHVLARFKRTLFIVAGLCIALSGVLFDIGFHPQFFTYNHVFGGVMGPIYDEELQVRGGLLAFRVLSCVWAFGFIVTARLFQPSNEKRKLWIQAGIAALALVILYANSAPLRITTPAKYAEQYLGGHARTEHFDVYFDPASMDSLQLKSILDEHEYRYAYLQENLQVSVRNRIKTYLYPDPETKDYLTGARNTSVAPVWLKNPQMHIVTNHFESVFAHELTHVFSREFGLPLLNASYSVGLVEGLAVAFEPSDGRPHPHEQVLAATGSLVPVDSVLSVLKAFPLQSSLSPLGFWTGRGAVSYTTMGSFVRYLADTYGVDLLKRVYAKSNFEEVYGKSVDVLVKEWEAFLLQLPAVSRSARDYVARRFAVPSLFEKTCPHHIPRFERHFRAGVQAFTEGDTTAALGHLNASLSEQPRFQPALDGWAQLTTAAGQVDAVVVRLSDELAGHDSASTFASPSLWIRFGDALAITGRPGQAQNAYDRAREGLPLYAQEQHGLVVLRRYLADWPAVILDMYSSTDASTKLQRLDTLHARQPLVALLQAYLHNQEGRFESAVKILEGLDLYSTSAAPSHQPLLERLRLIGLASAYEADRRYGAAAATADQLVVDFLDVGAFQEAAFYTDFARKMRYIEGR